MRLTKAQCLDLAEFTLERISNDDLVERIEGYFTCEYQGSGLLAMNYFMGFLCPRQSVLKIDFDGNRTCSFFYKRNYPIDNVPENVP